MKCSPSIALLVIISLFYLAISASGLAFLYFYYQDKILTLKEQYMTCLFELRFRDDVDSLAATGTVNRVSNGDGGNGIGCTCSKQGNDGATSIQDSEKDNSAVGRNDDNTNREIPHSALVLGRWTMGTLEYDSSSSYHPITSWGVGDTRRSYLHGVELNRGRLTVHVEGYYQVYSKVHFDVELVDGSISSMFHYTTVGNKLRANSPDNLMKSGVQICSDDPEASHSSFHSGIFLLISGDEISVRVSIPKNSRATFVPTSSYFGLYLLSET